MLPVTAPQDQAIRTLMRQAGQRAKQLADQPFEVTAKGPEDFVTNVDRMLDQWLAAQFQAWFPQAGVITEEDAQSWSALVQDYADLWLVDPLDGTEDFIHGRPDYAVMVGLLQGHHPRAGWIYSPGRDRMYWGGPNWGLFEAGASEPPQPMVALRPVSPRDKGYAIVIGDRDRRQYGQALQAEIPNLEFIGLGSFGLKVLEVIQGRAGLYLYLNGRVKLWDTTGPLALALAAGLYCCDVEGNPLRFTPEALVRDTLAHRQTIIVAWPEYFNDLQAPIQAAIQAVQGNSGSPID